tara:strand:+ start:198 stop:467 length:270 start_codon:yes stop_codon:yes gene_type:complete
MTKLRKTLPPPKPLRPVERSRGRKPKGGYASHIKKQQEGKSFNKKALTNLSRVNKKRGRQAMKNLAASGRKYRDGTFHGSSKAFKDIRK